MKNLFKTPNPISYITWQRALAVFILVFIVNCNGYGQEQDDYSEQDYGTYMTHRNNPFSQTELYNTIVQCRKLIKIDDVFDQAWNLQDISQVLMKPFENLTELDKESIIINGWLKRDTTLLTTIIKIAQSDTLPDQEYIRILSIECLSKYNTDKVEKVLTDLLKDRYLAMISALSLVQLGQTEQALKSIQSHYTESVNYEIIPSIVNALLKINTPDAIKLLMKISEHKDPSEALDALAALSLLGYCDFAYQSFCKYTANHIWQVRSMVANCLLYYTGTPEAINTVKNMYYTEKDSFVAEQLEGVLKKFNIKY